VKICSDGSSRTIDERGSLTVECVVDEADAAFARSQPSRRPFSTTLVRGSIVHPIHRTSSSFATASGPVGRPGTDSGVEHELLGTVRGPGHPNCKHDQTSTLTFSRTEKNGEKREKSFFLFTTDISYVATQLSRKLPHRDQSDQSEHVCAIYTLLTG
jgi:hypothetical protein